MNGKGHGAQNQQCTATTKAEKEVHHKTNYVSFENFVKSSQSIPTPSAGCSTIVRPGQIPSSAQSPVSLNLVDIFDKLKRAGGGSVRINCDNSISIDISK